jgi:hypothetical protein
MQDSMQHPHRLCHSHMPWEKSKAREPLPKHQAVCVHRHRSSLIGDHSSIPKLVEHNRNPKAKMQHPSPTCESRPVSREWNPERRRRSRSLDPRRSRPRHGGMNAYAIALYATRNGNRARSFDQVPDRENFPHTTTHDAQATTKARPNTLSSLAREHED